MRLRGTSIKNHQCAPLRCARLDLMVSHGVKLVHALGAPAPGAGFTTMETDMSKFPAITQLLPRRALLGLAAGL